jgi:DNA polymerase-3 subunit gamma/tau
MAYQALYRAWRPKTFAEIFGQDAIVRTLERQILSKRIAHAYLFCGPRGTGKTSAAKVFARAINCQDESSAEPCGVCESCETLQRESSMDVVEIDAASNNGVDEIRDLREKVKYPPAVAKYKVYIIDEVHMLSTGAFNALLKTLEEPPAHAVFILATTEPQRLPATILSRCQRFDFRRISVDTIVEKLMIVLGGIGREAEDGALYEIARAAEGALRDAESLLDVCLSYTDSVVTESLARDILGTSGRAFLFSFFDALVDCDARFCLEAIAEAMNTGRDPQVFARDVVTHARTALLAGIVGESLERLSEITAEDAARFRTLADRTPREKLMRIMELFMKAEPDMKWATQPRTILELCAVRACHPEAEPDASLAERVAKIESALKNGVAVQPVQAQRQSEVPTPAPRPEATQKAAEKPKAAPADAVLPPKEYLDAVAAVAGENPSVKAAMSEMTFIGVTDGVAYVEFPKKNLMYMKVLERKNDLFDAALTQTFGAPMKISMALEGAARPALKATPAPAKGVIELSYDIFGRENIELTE